jgi:hypothetical protein
MNNMQARPWARVARWAALAGLLGATWAQAQTSGCAPAAYSTLPVVNTGLPVVQIWTDNAAPIVDRENYVTGCMRITDGSKEKYGTGLYHGTLQLRGRGNTTWNMPKKGYRLKLTAAAPVLDMPAHKDWVLIANYADKTLLRNNIAFELSRRVDMDWTPRMRHADVYLNNEFLGNYQLGEKIEVDPARVAITKMKTADIAPPNVEGGYLLQVEYTDRLKPEDTFFTSRAYNFLMESPKEGDVQPAQKAYIASYVQGLEDAIFRGDFNPQTGVPAYMDVDTLVSYYLVQELLKNKDAAMGSSVYLFKERGDLLRMGPLWDFDISAGNIDFYQSAMYPEGWYLRNTTAWFDSLMRTPEFKNRVIARWKPFKDSAKGLSKYIDQQAKMLESSQRENFNRWPILNTYVWPNQAVTGSYKGEVEWLKNWLKKRIDWMDKNIKN